MDRQRNFLSNNYLINLDELIMKKTFIMAFAAITCGLTFTACSNEDNSGDYPYRRVLTFEDADWGTGTNFLGQKSWSSLIDDAQYYGSLLYDNEDEEYGWSDEGNTWLASELYSYPFWSGGIAISNYVEKDYTKASYTKQLAVSTQGGHNGSKNFAIVYYSAWGGPDAVPSIYFSDGKERIIDHMYVVNTSYTLNDMTNEWSTFTIGEDWLKIIATGFDSKGNETGEAEFYLAKDGKFVTTWTKFDLSVLGKVAKVKFVVDGSDYNAWGLSTPTYFAFDDVMIIY